MATRDLIADSRVLWQMLRGQSRSGTAAERLQAFYAPQASRYDDFRARLLHGRSELVERLVIPEGGTVVELGGGTGSNIDRFGSRMQTLQRYTLVDLCPALLEQAGSRARVHRNVELVDGDVTRYRPAESVDCVFFSYSLTMIDDWRSALANALTMLKPGGTLGIVDFYVSSTRPRPGYVSHPAWQRWLWRRWFAHDGVRLSPDHLEALADAMPDHVRLERQGALPYVPALKVPYYLFIGRKSEGQPVSGRVSGAPPEAEQS
jgi:S-adenosylmethionine-diacylgycerolhomoserine-N-methlytransferase